jgi:hypothetical protein
VIVSLAITGSNAMCPEQVITNVPLDVVLVQETDQVAVV